MSIAPIAANLASKVTATRPKQRPVDPDYGADRVQEKQRSATPSARVDISEQGRQALAASIANDADHGRDGK